jgi:long-chain acyl-CoA synthetase
MTARGDLPAVLTVSGGAVKTHTHGEIALTARCLAAGLIKRGVGAQAPVALWGPNSAELVTALLAIAASGAVPVPIDDLSSDAEAVRFLTDADCRFIFTTQSHLPALDALDDTADIILLDQDEGVGGSWREVMAEHAGDLPETVAADPALLVYTSGTTGAPKSFTLSHANIAANITALVAEHIVGPGDRVLLPLPLHHAYPLMCLRLALAYGAAVVFPESISGPHMIEALGAGRARAIVGVPRLYEALIEGLENRLASAGRPVLAAFRALRALAIAIQRLTGLRPGAVLFRPIRRKIAPDLDLVFSGGAKLSDSLIWKLEGLGWRVLNGYGLSETASVFTGNLPRAGRVGTDGKPFVKGCELRIADSDDKGIGEIQLRGPSVFAGYRSPPDANEQAFTADGWFRTGDLGRVDADGFLDVTGRIKEMIVLAGGENIYPEILEAIYLANPYIAELALLEIDGNLAALVLPDLAAIRADTNAGFKDVIRVTLSEIGRELAPFQRLTGFAITRTPLPRTRLGKFQRFKLPELYRRARSGETAAPAGEMSDDDRRLIAGRPARQVWELLKARFPDRDLSLDDSPELDLGLDSLGWVGLGLELQTKFGIELAEQDFAAALTLRDLLKIASAADAGGRSLDGISDQPIVDRKRWVERAGPAQTALTAALYGFNRLVLRLVFRLGVQGRAHLPARGPFVLAVNHVSDMDPAALWAALPWDRARQIRWSGDAGRLFSGPVRRFFAQALRIFPVDEHQPLAALETAGSVLDHGDVLAWFPESWRSPDGRLQRFQTGIGMLLKDSEVAVVPVWIEGAFEAWPRQRRLPRPHKVTVRFGAPVTPATLAEAGKGDTREARIANALRGFVARLAPVPQPEVD